MESTINPPAEQADLDRVSAPGAELFADREPGAGVSIIVPCWREDALPAAVAASWLRHLQVREVLVAMAGGAGSPPVELAGMRIVLCPQPGRGPQMNQAAGLAKGEMLLFQHADTELTDDHLRSLDAALSDARIGGGAFRRRFDERHPHLRWIEPWEALRCRCFGPVFGDQSIFVRRSIFEELGGFAALPLMEDVEFSCRLRKRAGLTILAPAIGSSPRKHLAQGRWRSTLLNALLLLLYVLRVSPDRLHRWYYRPRN